MQPVPQTGAFAGAFPIAVPVVFPVETERSSTELVCPRVAKPQTTDVWGTPFARLDMTGTLEVADQVIRARHPEYFVTANLNYLMLTEQHPRLAEVNECAVAVIADGHPLVLRSRLGKSPLPCRVAGSDIIVELCQLAAERDYRPYFLGAAPGVAEAAAKEMQRRFPRLQIAGYQAPPFRQLSSSEHQQMLNDIRQARPDMLFVAFGQPKGEFWILDHLHELQVPLSIQIGASFDFLAGTARRAPMVWQRIGCEWLYRAVSEPRRLGPRYARNIWFLAKTICRELGSLRLCAGSAQQPPAEQSRQHKTTA